MRRVAEMSQSSARSLMYKKDITRWMKSNKKCSVHFSRQSCFERIDVCLLKGNSGLKMTKLMLERRFRWERWRKSRLKIPFWIWGRTVENFSVTWVTWCVLTPCCVTSSDRRSRRGPRTTSERELTSQEGLEVRIGSFSTCEGVQAGVQCLENSFVASCSTPEVAIAAYDLVALVGTSTHVARSINPCCAFHRTRAFFASSAICDVLRVSGRPDERTALRWHVSVWILPKFFLAVRSFSSSGQSLNWQSSLVCSIFCVWISALLLSVFLFELRKLEGLPTERCSTESQALRRGGRRTGRRWKDFCLCTRGGLPLLTTSNLLGELAQCSACWSLPRRWAAWSRWWRSR